MHGKQDIEINNLVKAMNEWILQTTFVTKRSVTTMCDSSR